MGDVRGISRFKSGTPVEDKDLKRRAIQELNSLLGQDLGKCGEIRDHLLSKQKELKETLSLQENPMSDEEPSKMQALITSVDSACRDILDFNEKISEAARKADDLKASKKQHAGTIDVHLEKMEKLLCLRHYAQTLDNLNERSNQIEFCVSVNDAERAIEEYQKLCGIALRLLNSKAAHLRKFSHDSAQYWNDILKKTLSEDFGASMKSVYWPIVSTTSHTSTPSPDAISRFQSSMRYLLQAHLPPELDPPAVSSSLFVSFPKLSPPMVALLLPLRKRFNFHFSGSRQTNRWEKPEWYFTQVLTWIKAHEGFINKLVSPIYEESEDNPDAELEFISGLVELAVTKLQSDLEQVIYDEGLFSHTVDESLGFDKELRENFAYPETYPSAISVLTQAQIFVKWINMEKKFARQKMDEMLSSETAWTPISPEDKVTEVAHTFLAIMNGITDRYSSLLQPGHKLQFIDLQIELVDELRVSLLQVLHSERSDPLNSKLPDVLNTVDFLINTFCQWDLTPPMILLEYYRNKNSETPTNGMGIFKTSLPLMVRLREQLLVDLKNALMIEVKARSRPYRRDYWHSSQHPDPDEMKVSKSGSYMYQALADKLHLMETRLSPDLFSQLVIPVANDVKTFLVEEIILENVFSPKGALILRRDIEKCVIPIFKVYTKNPEHYFAIVLQACSLLALKEVGPEMKRASVTGIGLDVFKKLPVDVSLMANLQISMTIKRRLDVNLEVP